MHKLKLGPWSECESLILAIFAPDHRSRHLLRLRNPYRGKDCCVLRVFAIAFRRCAVVTWLQS